MLHLFHLRHFKSKIPLEKEEDGKRKKRKGEREERNRRGEEEKRKRGEEERGEEEEGVSQGNKERSLRTRSKRTTLITPTELRKVNRTFETSGWEIRVEVPLGLSIVQ